MALAVAVVHQMGTAVEEVVHWMKVTVEEVEAGAEGGLPKKLEQSVLVSVSWAAGGAVGWRMDGVVLAKAVVEADQWSGVVQLGFWEVEEGGRPR